MRILIDASSRDEVRVGMVKKSGELLEYFFEDTQSSQVKGSIFLGTVTRVEPSLQAAFIDYGAERDGFLPFREVHPDYFHLSNADKEAYKASKKAESSDFSLDFEGSMESTSLEMAADSEQKPSSFRTWLQKQHKKHKMQDVVKPNQVVLVQIVKEERPRKGAALTTFISLAGRYCVFLPNSPYGCGVSKRIRDTQAREDLTKAVSALKLDEGSSFVVRSACDKQIKANLKRDHTYLHKVWNRVRAKTLQSTAPTLIYREFNAALRVVRDLWTDDVEGVWIDGEEQYKIVRSFLKEYSPRQVSKLNLYKETAPIFTKHSVDSQIDALFESTVYLPSGGHIVINQTEALVAIDVNSGKATKERNIEDTALQTNIDAAKEVARQVRLRDLSGLFVIDFIDMEDAQHRTRVEKAIQEAMSADRARIQIGRISSFGLLEMSRQRLGYSAMDKIMHRCPRCSGSGMIKQTQFLTKQLLRALEHLALYNKNLGTVVAHVPQVVALSLLASPGGLQKACGSYELNFEFISEGCGMKVVDEKGRTVWCEMNDEESV